jgi:hypothetical protein
MKIHWGDGAYKIAESIRHVVEATGEYINHEFHIFIDEMKRVVHWIFAEGARFVGHVIESLQLEIEDAIHDVDAILDDDFSGVRGVLGTSSDGR